MADRQRNGDESFFEGNLGGLEEEGKGRRRPGGGGAVGGDAPGGVSTPGQDSH